ncbi:MAG: ATP-binding cassette domain-containing protein [Tissierellaceae bacterium]|jgi:putative ABC transport system permease protein|nr:ABC transporter ATP-binding protein/permease [Tissierellia bacterium]
MLQVKNISKKYITGELVQSALDDLSLNLRKNEFVAVLGPSGSGKTTLLNIIGGLDRYDRGDLIINGISTKKYRDRDWDSYRNHSIGFVFQSYNLIPHQSILANVELALTISGVSRSERKKRAKEALEVVGLGEHVHKRPNQLSGGQMQRVAIARALINNPDILLADEPTGALDSETSLQVMELLKEVAKDRLVIMVTHNAELAEKYATRIVKLRDGRIIDDSDPYLIEDISEEDLKHKNMGKASMSFFTSLALSFNNLLTKKGRTLLTAFSGSIGIIGIALILALSNGVNKYIEDIQRDTMTSYPITIDEQTFDFSSIMAEGGPGGPMGQIDEEPDHDLEAVYSNSQSLEIASQITSSLMENNLTEFKKYLDDPKSEIQDYLGENGIIYSYNVAFSVFTRNPEGDLIDSNENAFFETDRSSHMPGVSEEVETGMRNTMSSMMEASPRRSMFESDIFQELLPGSGDDLISAVTTDSYDLVHGSWPQAYDEVVVVLNKDNELPTTALYSLGLLPQEEYEKIKDILDSGEEFIPETYRWDYDEVLDQVFYLIPSCDYYVENEDGYFDYIGNDEDELEKLVEDALQLRVTGIIKPAEDAKNANIRGAVGYTNALTDYIIEYSNNSPVVQAQLANPDTNILNGFTFEPLDDETKIEDAKEYIDNLGISDKATLIRRISLAAYADNPEVLQAMQNMDEAQLAGMMDQFMQDPDDEVLLDIYDRYISSGSYDDNMNAFGFVSLDAPSSISIYADTFEDKDRIAEAITNYNAKVDEENRITYTDFVAMMTSSITTIINVISYVLIAFVAVSLVVSSIMIGIITYISVVERTKEIGILRALGASKGNISQVFNAETFIIGLFSGILGVGISILLTYPINKIIHNITNNPMVNAYLPLVNALALVILSVILTLIGGLIPARKAAKKDPVTALRTE